MIELAEKLKQHVVKEDDNYLNWRLRVMDCGFPYTGVRTTRIWNEGYDYALRAVIALIEEME